MRRIGAIGVAGNARSSADDRMPTKTTPECTKSLTILLRCHSIAELDPPLVALPKEMPQWHAPPTS